jgi:hypothetical protein
MQPETQKFGFFPLQQNFRRIDMASEEAIAEFEAVKAVFGDCIEEPANGFEKASFFFVNILPDTGGVKVRQTLHIFIEIFVDSSD